MNAYESLSRATNRADLDSLISSAPASLVPCRLTLLPLFLMHLPYWLYLHLLHLVLYPELFWTLHHQPGVLIVRRAVAMGWGRF